VAAGALRPHGEEVVALAPHADAELDRLSGARLARHALEGLELGGGGEGEARGLAAPAQQLGGERSDHAPPV
jgi:hypothetical protein